MKEEALVIPGPKVKPKGRYTVELFDAASGVLIETREVENYISPMYALHMAGLQYQYPWHNAQLASNSDIWQRDASPSSNPTANLLTDAPSPWSNRVWAPNAIAGFPSDSLIITDDDTAEDTDSHWLRGRVVAWATRWKANPNASGQRGQINEAECLYSNDGMTHKTVWDFTTQQGNGTFQTLAIGSLETYSQSVPGRQWCAIGPPTILLDDLAPTQAVNQQSGISGMVIVGTTAYWCAPDSNSSTANVVVWSAPAADIFAAPAHPADPYVLDAGGTPTNVVDSGINYAAVPGGNSQTGLPTWNTITPTNVSLTRLGTTGDFVIAWPGRNTGSSVNALGRTVNIRRFTAAGSLVWATTPIAVSTVDIDASDAVSIHYDGSNLFVTVGNGDTTIRGNIYRIDPATGALSATIPIPGGVLCDGSSVFDGTDLYIQTEQGLLKLSTAGALVSPYCYGKISDISQPTETAVAPWLTTTSAFGYMIGRGLQAISQWQTGPVGSGISNSARSDTSSRGMAGTFNQFLSWFSYPGGGQPTGHLVYYAGKLWQLYPFGVSPNVAPNGSCLNAVVGANMVSRTVLESPITKTSSQNMKITYEITFPESDLTTVPAHLDL